MLIDDYQEKAVATAIYNPAYAVMYPTLGLAGEAGEVADKIKKVYRDSDGVMDEGKMAEIGKEIGDVLWYCAALARDLGLTLSEIAQGNLDKLYSRRDRGVLQGSGDNR